MNLNELIEEKKISKYRLSKQTGIPYATLSDLCSGKTRITKCSAETVFRLAKELQISMEELLEPFMEYRLSFELYKSNVCHRLKELGDIDFLLETLQGDSIEVFYKKGWYPESLYLLAMVDYLSRINDIPLCEKYNSFRKSKLKSVLFPSSILSMYAATQNDQVKTDAINDSIPEFIRFNIVENEVRNVN